MSPTDKFNILRKLLRTIGLSEERVDELLAWIEEWLSADSHDEAGARQSRITFPYQLRDDFLTAAELAFYRALQLAVRDWAVVFPKVRLGDIFIVRTADNKEWYRARNRIERKHLDFLLCDPTTLKPLLGVELNDSSHNRQDRKERDKLVVGVFEAAGLPLVGIAWRPNYPQEELNRFLRSKLALPATNNGKNPENKTPPPTTQTAQPELAAPSCPQCGSPMILRTARQGKGAGNQFWGCSTYPHCKGIVSVTT